MKTTIVYQIKKVWQEIWNFNKRCVYEKDYVSACILHTIFIFQTYSSFDLGIHIQVPNLSNKHYFGHASHIYFIPNKFPSIQIWVTASNCSDWWVHYSGRCDTVVLHAKVSNKHGKEWESVIHYTCSLMLELDKIT